MNFNLLIVILVAALFRLPLLQTVPNGFHRDEASYAYDAFSLAETLRDRSGEFLPLFVKAFADYREGLYMYLLAPFIKIFGLNEITARSLSAVIGILTVITIYCLVKECLGEKVATLSGLFLAISPWHIFFSRTSYRLILLPLLFSLGLLFFVKSLKKPIYLVPSGFVFGLSIYTYISSRAFVPLMLLCLIILFWKHLWTHKGMTLAASALFLLIFIPLFSIWISPQGMSRTEQVGLVTTPLQAIQNYLAFFDPRFLFIGGDDRILNNPPKVGQLYLFEIITLPLGIFCLIKEHSNRNSNYIGWILLAWLIFYPLPASLTIETPNALRTLVGPLVLSIFSAYGAYKLIEWSGKRRILNALAMAVLVANVALTSKFYYIDYSRNNSQAWQYGMREAITYAERSSYQNVIVSDGFQRPYIFILFYTQYPPEVYQKSPIVETQDSHSPTDYRIGKYYVTSSTKPLDLKEKSLYILPEEEFSQITSKGYQWKEVHQVQSPKGDPIIRLLEVS